MEGLTTNLQYFYWPVKSFDLHLMDLKELVSAFLKRVTLTHSIQFGPDQWPQIIMVQVLNTEKSRCRRTVSVPFPFSRMEMSAPARSITDLEILLCLQPVFSIECCADTGIYAWIVELCISVEECNLPTPAQTGHFLSNQAIFM